MKAAARDQCKRLIEAGPGWHPYVIDKAECMERAEPEIYRGLLSAVELAIGAIPVIRARKALEWFRRNEFDEKRAFQIPAKYYPMAEMKGKQHARKPH